MSRRKKNIETHNSSSTSFSDDRHEHRYRHSRGRHGGGGEKGALDLSLVGGREHNGITIEISGIPGSVSDSAYPGDDVAKALGAHGGTKYSMSGLYEAANNLGSSGVLEPLGDGFVRHAW